jgi:hypothetical protein
MTPPLPFAGFDRSRLSVHLARQAVAEVAAESRPPVRRIVMGMAGRVEALLAPAAACRLVPAEWYGRTRLLADGTALLDGLALARLGGVPHLAVGFATIGEPLGLEAAACFARGDAVAGLLLDQIGTAALHRLGRRLEAGIRLAARRSGRRAGSPLHPGDAGLPLTIQAGLAAVADAGSAGIRVTATAMLAPAKSLSMVIGIGDGARRWSQAEVCRACPSQGRCRHGLKRGEACA